MKAKLLMFSLVLAMFAVSAFGQDEEFFKGVELYREGKFQESSDVLQRVVKAQPKNIVAWRYLGASLENLGRHDEALAAFKKKGGGKTPRLEYDKKLEITGTVKAPYDDDQASRRRLQGDVVLLVEFKADGTIGFIAVLRDLSPGLTKSSIAAARGITFRPAVVNGKPVPEIRPVSYPFRFK